MKVFITDIKDTQVGWFTYLMAILMRCSQLLDDTVKVDKLCDRKETVPLSSID